MDDTKENLKNDITLNIDNFKYIMTNHGLSFSGIGEYAGKNAAYEAIKRAIEPIMSDNITINSAFSITVYFVIHPNYPWTEDQVSLELDSAINLLMYSFNDATEVIVGTETSETLPLDFVQATVIITGFEKNPMIVNDIK